MTKPVGLQDFYKNKNIFISGGSGFVGICLLEKILRKIPNHGTIYLLLRPKRGKSVEERLEDLKKNQIFETVLKEKKPEEVFSKIKSISGDVGQEHLGLSKEDRKILTDNVHIIIHCAATLDFAETLKTTVNINLLGTRRMVELARECSKIEAFVHVSSAYVNAWRLEAEETIYPLTMNPDELIAMSNKLDVEELEKKLPMILGNHPNAYTITKHMAEHEVAKLENEIPCVIVRPSMIIGAWKEPVPGWTISKNGPQGFILGALKGVIRRLPVASHLIYDYIPVDIVVNNLLTAAYYVGIEKPKKTEVYHCTTSTTNPFKWDNVMDKLNSNIHTYPIMSSVWYPYLKFLPSVLWFKISVIFVHILPGFFLDLLIRATGGRPILMKLHRNVNFSLGKLEKFIFTEWKFFTKNTRNLQEWLKDRDQIDFNIDVSTLDWPKYFSDLTLGARTYLCKEPIKTLNAARRKQSILYFVHLIWQGLILISLWYLYACLTGFSMYKSSYCLIFLWCLSSLL